MCCSANKQERFGVESVHWLGSPGHGKGLAQQIRDLQAVAAAPVNSRRWRAPDIVVFFPSSVDEGVAAALRDMGVKVAAGPGDWLCPAGRGGKEEGKRRHACRLQQERWPAPDFSIKLFECWTAAEHMQSNKEHMRLCMVDGLSGPTLARSPSIAGVAVGI